MKFQEAYSKFQSIIRKVPMKYVYFVLLLALLSFTVWTRVQPLYLPQADFSAEQNVMNFYEQQIKSSIDAQYPNLPEQNKQVLVDKELASFVRDNSVDLADQTAMLSEQIRSKYQDATGQTYLLGIDPYHYYRQAYYEIEYSMPGNTVENDVVRDTYRLAPLGVEGKSTFHSSFSAQWHKFLNLFGDYSLTYTFFMVGVLFVTLSVLFFTLFLTKHVGHVPALIAGLVFATAVFFVSRTTGESSDTDIYVLFFPVLCLFLYTYTRSRLLSLVTTFIAGLSIGFYSYAWGAWWYFMFIFTASIIGDLIISKVKGVSVMDKLHHLALFMIASFLSVGYFSGVQTFFTFITSPLTSFLNFKNVAQQNLWPNIYTTVAELNAVSLDTVVTQLGGSLLVLLSLIGTVYACYLAYRNNYYIVAMFIVAWWAASLYTTTLGIRFILLVVLSYSLGLAYCIKCLYDACTWLHAQAKIPVNVGKLLVTAIFAILLVMPVLAGVSVAQNSGPSVDDGVYNTLVYLKDNTASDSIITSWWDFGYWFRAIADRPVTFDGGTQVGYNAYWVGKLLSSEEDLAVGITRMLNCGQNTAFEQLYPVIGNHQETIDILESIVVLPRLEALETLESVGAPDVIEYTHCEAPTSLLITSGDMVGKAPVWGHFGAWNYTKAFMYQNVSSLPATQALATLESFGLSQTQAIQEFNAMQVGADGYIAPYPGYLADFTCTGNTTLRCDIVYQGQTGSFTYGNGTITGDIYAGVYLVDGVEYAGSGRPELGIYLDTELKQGYYSSVELLDSTFANLFYLGDTQCYTLVTQGSGTIGKIMVWETDYSCLE